MVLSRGYWYYLHTTTNYVAYCYELHISGYAVNQKAKGCSPTDVINIKKFAIWPLAGFVPCYIVSLTPINGPASFAIVSRCTQ